MILPETVDEHEPLPRAPFSIGDLEPSERRLSRMDVPTYDQATTPPRVQAMLDSDSDVTLLGPPISATTAGLAMSIVDAAASWCQSNQMKAGPNLSYHSERIGLVETDHP
jgi:hypothetical protein